MTIGNIKRRVEKIEKSTGIGSNIELLPPMIVLCSTYEGGTVPNVIDRPIEEWELYKRSMSQHSKNLSLGLLDPLIVIDPLEEYRLRTGRDEAPPDDRIPASMYKTWRHSDKNEQKQE